LNPVFSSAISEVVSKLFYASANIVWPEALCFWSVRASVRGFWVQMSPERMEISTSHKWCYKLQSLLCWTKNWWTLVN